MNILLTNDDGIDTGGINTLYDVISEHYNIYIIAPDGEKSACSNAININSEIKVKKIAENKFAVSGFPADCVNIGLNSGIIPDVDLIISGINKGPNLGDDLFFSGTVAGARTAYIFGKTGIAISIDCYPHPSEFLYNASNFLIKFINDIKSEMLESPQFFNINYPDLPEDRINGVKFTFTGKRIYNDCYIKTEGNSDEMVLSLTGSIHSIPSAGSDITELKNGFISITPLTIDCTDFSYLEKECKS